VQTSGLQFNKRNFSWMGSRSSNNEVIICGYEGEYVRKKLRGLSPRANYAYRATAAVSEVSAKFFQSSSLLFSL
jgi:hypothetical protein